MKVTVSQDGSHMAMRDSTEGSVFVGGVLRPGSGQHYVEFQVKPITPVRENSMGCRLVEDRGFLAGVSGMNSQMAPEAWFAIGTQVGLGSNATEGSVFVGGVLRPGSGQHYVEFQVRLILGQMKFQVRQNLGQ